MVEDKHGGSGKPLSVHLAPYGLAPTRVGNGEVDAVFGKVVPKDSCCKVSQGIEKVVGHHLRLSACSAGEVHQHSIVVVVWHCGALKLRCIVPLAVPVVESFVLFWSNADKNIKRWAIGLRCSHLLHDVFLSGADYGLYACAVVSIYYVVSSEHVGGRNGHGSDLV